MATLIVEKPVAVPVENEQTGSLAWTGWEKFLFRVAFIFFILLVIPIDYTWYVKLISVKTFFAFLNTLTGYRTNFYVLHSESGRWGLGAYVSWGIALLAGLVGGGIWTFFSRKSKRTEYNNLYYWLRVAVRYRIAIGIIAFGFLKFYPMQMPTPSLSNLDANFGDYNTYKIYWQVVGVSIWYEVVLGIVEILGGILVLFRQTAAIGAVLVAGVLYNIAHANIAYDGGVHVYSGLFVLFSLFILIPYIPNLWKLLIKGENVTPHYYYPKLNTKWQKIVFHGAKYGVIFVFTILFGILRYDVHYHVGQLKEPITPGLKNATGYYNVTEFRLNGKVIPYSPLDSVRWQNAIFEKWSTLIYKVNKPFPISLANGGPNPKDVDRNYELAGIAGGRRFLFYTINAKKQQLVLQDKDRPATDEDASALFNTVKAKKKKAKKKEDKKLVWNFSRPSADRIILSGLNDKKDSIYVVLDRVKKDYPIRIDRSNYTTKTITQ
ncbi:hypothetical protein HDF18_06360 [Mucilaginibacter sp. X5P1]|uniref:hypothetical protein n=1 Tax=Mucilaginibacter sp. X5P1 TaxID=2723088 RepID=UPI00161962AA|nr:hypothetical protein [Mucilaginibacter sp. X5P1]MBB6137259.1 hypothetical protein [Mucilaginibacter sp. X5P1]